MKIRELGEAILNTEVSTIVDNLVSVALLIGFLALAWAVVVVAGWLWSRWFMRKRLRRSRSRLRGAEERGRRW